MNWPAPFAIAIRTLADWLDDRLTIAAIGLATGYFGLGDAQWNAIANWIVGTATVILVLVPDPRKRVSNELPPIDLQSRSESGHADTGVDTVQPVDFVRQPVSASSRVEPDTRPNLGGFSNRD